MSKSTIQTRTVNTITYPMWLMITAITSFPSITIATNKYSILVSAISASKEGVAEIDEGMILGNEKYPFFEKCNPQWRRGTELPCVGVIDWALLFGYIKKYFNKPCQPRSN